MGVGGFFSGLFSPPRVDLWQRYERLRDSTSGTMSAFYKVKDKKTGDVRGLKIDDRAKLARVEAS